MILAPQEVHVWLVDISQFDPDSIFYLLSPEEQSKAQRFHFAKDRKSYTVSHGAVRIILSKYLGISPEKIMFGTESHGKPLITYPSNPPLHYNLSHSGLRALIAISHQPIGVDVEQIRSDFDHLSLAPHIMSSQELHSFQQLPTDQKQSTFFLLWTRKEAYIKAIGKGLSYPLQKFSISLDWHYPKIIEDQVNPNEPKRWQMYTVDVGENYLGTVVCASGDFIIQRQQFVLTTTK
ncbi:4'-phosphopantetheinyl transferase family protein [Thermoflavimicrobium daqui]|nr:4'-phosphopantetheinyl transferase superfamily protein [Thermoflavimicrobium daqui]